MGGDMPVIGITCGDAVCPWNSSCDDSGEIPVCDCLPGFEGPQCLDVNECGQANDCAANAVCSNAFGTYDCQCSEGYVGNGQTCAEDDECPDNPCAVGADCDDTDGYSCSCASGTFGNGYYCQGTDTCATDPCGGNGACVVTSVGAACQCNSGYQGASDCSACGTNLVIPDLGLLAAINVHLGRAVDDASAIPVAALAGHKSLDVWSYGVTNLSGIECWPDLEDIELSFNQDLTDLGPLSKLNRLRILDLNCTAVTSLDALEGHPTLAELSVNASSCGQALTDRSALPSLPALTVLDLAGQGLTDLSDLAGLKAIVELRLGSNAIGSLSSAPALPLLRRLDLTDNLLSSLDGIEAFERLQVLSVGVNQLEDASALTQLDALRTLDAGGNQLTALPDLSQLGELTGVSLPNNQLASVTGLAALPGATYLDISGNDVEDIEPFVAADFAGTLVIAGNPLPCETQEAHILTLLQQGVQVVGTCVP